MYLLQKRIKKVLLLASILVSTNNSAHSQSGKIETISFKFDSYSIDKKYQKILTHIAHQLNSDTLEYLKIVGYADTLGSEEYNDRLSAKRATAVYQYLLSRARFDTTKVYLTWIGKSADAYDLHFPSASVQKKCVDIWITFYKKPEL